MAILYWSSASAWLTTLARSYCSSAAVKSPAAASSSPSFISAAVRARFALPASSGLDTVRSPCGSRYVTLATTPFASCTSATGATASRAPPSASRGISTATPALRRSAQARSVVRVAASTCASVMPGANSPRPSAAQTAGAQLAKATAVSESRRSRPVMPASSDRVVAASSARSGGSTRSPLRITAMGPSSMRLGLAHEAAASAVMNSVGASCGNREVDMGMSPRGRSEAETGALDVLLDLVLADPDLRVRLEVHQGRIHLVEHDALTAVHVLDGLELAGEHVARTQLLSLPRPGVGPGVLLLVTALVAHLDTLLARRDHARRAGGDERLLDVLHEGADRDVLHRSVGEGADDDRGRLPTVRVGVSLRPTGAKRLVDELVGDQPRIGVIPPAGEVGHGGRLDASDALGDASVGRNEQQRASDHVQCAEGARATERHVWAPEGAVCGSPSSTRHARRVAGHKGMFDKYLGPFVLLSVSTHVDEGVSVPEDSRRSHPTPH